MQLTHNLFGVVLTATILLIIVPSLLSAQPMDDRPQIPVLPPSMSDAPPIIPPVPQNQSSDHRLELPHKSSRYLQEIITDYGRSLAEVESSEKEARESRKSEWSEEDRHCEKVDEILGRIVESVNSHNPPPAQSRMTFERAVLDLLLPSEKDDDAAEMLRIEIASMLREVAVPRQLTPAERHQWLEVTAKFKMILTAREEVETVRQLLSRNATADLLLVAEQRLYAAKTDFAMAAFGRFSLTNDIAKNRIDRAISLIRLKQREHAWASTLSMWKVTHARIVSGVESSYFEWQARQAVYMSEANWHAAKLSDLDLYRSIEPSISTQVTRSKSRHLQFRPRRR